MEFDQYFINGATWVATKSKDRSTKVGAMVVDEDHRIRSTGYNNFCTGINDDVDKRHERPEKYSWTEHGERNAVYSAALVGVSLKGCTMYQNFAPTSCTDCARAIIQSGIVCSVGPPIPFPGKGDWDRELDLGIKMMLEAGVKLYVYDGERRITLINWMGMNK
jgi:dCMP deaminase